MGHLDPRQLPEQGKPWTSVLSLDFIYHVDLIMPEECYEPLRRKLIEERPAPRYYRVTMPLSAMLDGLFFTEYIKIGREWMASRGTMLTDGRKYHNAITRQTHRGECLHIEGR
jgi:ribonuclease P/MRP protein subunit RPP40